jgi:SAM-dependent methyltransferase
MTIEFMSELIKTTKASDVSFAWQSYWSNIKTKSLPILWDYCSEKSSALDLPRFYPLVDPQLPLIDFACGNGTQSAFLSKTFSRVIGVDVSPSAIALAKSLNSTPNTEYRVLDAFLIEQAKELHEQIGDANVYMRTGIHHIPPQKRPAMAESLKILLGNKGVGYFIELGENAISYFTSIAELYGGKLPYEIELVTQHNIGPGSITPDDISLLFPEFSVLADGNDVINTVHILPNGENAKVPAYYTIIKRKPA